jgi:hypothetical protein
MTDFKIYAGIKVMRVSLSFDYANRTILRILFN